MFKFKLKPLLTLRESIEKAKKRELGTLNMELQALSLQMEQFQMEKFEVKNELKKSVNGMINLQEIQTYQHYLVKLEAKEKVLAGEIANKEKQVEAKKTELAEAMKQRKIMENLEGVEKEAYRLVELEKEQKLVDEIISYKYTQKGKVENDG